MQKCFVGIAGISITLIIEGYNDIIDNFLDDKHTAEVYFLDVAAKKHITSIA